MEGDSLVAEQEYVTSVQFDLAWTQANFLFSCCVSVPLWVTVTSFYLRVEIQPHTFSTSSGVTLFHSFSFPFIHRPIC